NTRIFFDGRLRRLLVLPGHHFDRVLARLDAQSAGECAEPAATGRPFAFGFGARCGRAGRAFGARWGARWRRDRPRAQIPHDAVDAHVLRAVEIANLFAVLVEDDDANLLFVVELRLQVVIDDGAVRRVRTEEHLLSGGAA